MITVKTATSKVVNLNGVTATGVIIVTPSAGFEFTDNDVATTRKKVTLEPLQIQISAGCVHPAGFLIAPTIGASQDKVNLFYTARFITNVGNWTEYWQIDGGGSATLELSDIVRVIPDNVAKTDDFIGADEVSVKAGANLIPRADSSGKLDASWIASANLLPTLGYTASTTLPTVPTGYTAFAILILDDTTDPIQTQVMFWDGWNWSPAGIGVGM